VNYLNCKRILTEQNDSDITLNYRTQNCGRIPLKHENESDLSLICLSRLNLIQFPSTKFAASYHFNNHHLIDIIRNVSCGKQWKTVCVCRNRNVFSSFRVNDKSPKTGTRIEPSIIAGNRRSRLEYRTRRDATRHAKAFLTLTLARVWLVDCMTSWQRRRR